MMENAELGTLPLAQDDGDEVKEIRLAIEPHVAGDEGKEKEENDSQVLGPGELLSHVPAHRRVGLWFSDVHAWAPNLLAQGKSVKHIPTFISRCFASAKEEKAASATKQRVLYGLSGGVAPGEVLAMMGPSGSGKTSLLSILGGRAPKLLEVKGTILFNGEEMTKTIKRKIGFVTQDDLMYETLTVFETLYYSALLKLPSAMTRSEKLEQVEAVIVALGLDKCRGTLIGGPMMRGVSGGERKRVAVGHELLTNPSILMLDEPTSGLDATTAMHLITILRKLAEGGRSIITTIHQPSSRLYQQLDTLMLLSEGHTMFYGDAKLVKGWFKMLDYPLPLDVNIADFILDLANGDIVHDTRSGEQCRKDLVSSFTSMQIKKAHGVTCEEDIVTFKDDDFTHSPVSSSSQAALSDKFEVKSVTQDESSEKWGAGFVEQVKVLSSRTVRTRRFDTFSNQTFIQLVGIATISGLLWWQTGKKSTLLAASDVSGLLFFELIFSLFNSMYAALFTFPQEFRMMAKERSSGMYRLSAFYLSRSASELPMDCFVPSVFVIIIYWLGGLRATFAAFISHWLSMLLSLLVSQSVGLIIGASVMEFKKAQTIASLLMLTMMLTGGYFIRKVPSWLSWLKYCSNVFYGYNMLMKIEFGDRQYQDCGGLGLNTNDTCVPIPDLKDALSLSVNVDESIWMDTIVLVVAFFGLRFALYEVLKRKTRG